MNEREGRRKHSIIPEPLQHQLGKVLFIKSTVIADAFII